MLAKSNPWSDLPDTPPYVLPTDRAVVEAFNKCARPDHQLHLDIIPEHFLGNPEAPVVLLNKNPGFSESDADVHLDPAFNRAATENLHHRARWPLYLLDPNLPSPGQDWWLKKLRALIAVTSREEVAHRVFVAELHGYHSKRFSGRLAVPSMEYTRALVRRAIGRGAEIVVMRGLREWTVVIPELSRIPKQLVRNVQNPAISPGNLGDFSRIVERINSAR